VTGAVGVAGRAVAFAGVEVEVGAGRALGSRLRSAREISWSVLDQVESRHDGFSYGCST
jgi:hypothetical protein